VSTSRDSVVRESEILEDIVRERARALALVYGADATENILINGCGHVIAGVAGCYDAAGIDDMLDQIFAMIRADAHGISKGLDADIKAAEVIKKAAA